MHDVIYILLMLPYNNKDDGAEVHITNSQRHGMRKIVSYTLSRSFSFARVVVVLNEFPPCISSIKYLTGDLSNRNLSDTNVPAQMMRGRKDPLFTSFHNSSINAHTYLHKTNNLHT